MPNVFARVAIATTMGMGLSTLVTMVPAQATTGPMNYDCTITSPITKTTPATVTYDTSLPAKAYLGDPAMKLDLDGKGSIDSGTVNLAYGFPYNARAVQGRSTIGFGWNGGTINVQTVGDKVPLVKDKAADLSKFYPAAMTVPVPTTVGSYTLVMPTNYTSVNALYNSGGGLAADPTASCVHRSGNRNVDTMEVWGKATAVLNAPATAAPGSRPQVTANVTAPGITGFTGTVTFTQDGIEFASVPVSNGKATATLPAVEVGDHVIGATLTTPTPFAEAQPVAQVPMSVSKIQTTTKLTLDSYDAATNETVTAKVSVTSGNGTPPGQVKVSVNGNDQTVDLLNGVAEVPLPSLPIGTHQVTADYLTSEPELWTASAAEPAELGIRVPAAATTTVLTLDRTSGTAGDPVKATVKVTSPAGEPAGVGKVVIGGRSVQGNLVNGQIVLDLPPLPAGSHDVKAEFAPADVRAFARSESAVVSLVLATPANLAQTFTDVTLVQSSVRAGVAPQARIFVSATSGLAAGEITVTVGTRVLAPQPISQGKVTVTLPSNLGPGNYPVSATFAPTGSFTESSGVASGQLEVTKAPSTTELALSADETTTATQVTATATVLGPDAGGNPNGSVTFTSGTFTQTVPVSAGTASVNLGLLAPGHHSVSAKFTPASESWLNASTAISASVEVTKAPSTTPALPTTTTLSLARSEIVVGHGGGVTATIAGAANAAGTVEFAINGQHYTVPVVADRAALSVPATLPVGTHQITARFLSADATEAMNSTAAAVTLTVKAAGPVVKTATTTTLQAPAKATVTGKVALTATVTGATQGKVVFNLGTRNATVALSGGKASASLVADVVGSQRVTATFVPTDSARVASSYRTATVVVGKRSSKTTVTAKVKKASKLVVLTSRTAPVDQFCGGKVTFQIRTMKGKKVVAKVVGKGSAAVMCSGSAQAFVKLPAKKGTYQVTALFGGSSTVNASKGIGTFKR